MNVRNCKTCGKLFNYLAGPPICLSCRDTLEAKFSEVKEYVRTNRLAGINEVAEACEVEVRQIKQWVREERLEFSPESSVGIDCEGCGVMIRCGKFCEKCKNEMAKQFSNSIKKKEPPKPIQRKDPRDNPKMRFLSEE